MLLHQQLLDWAVANDLALEILALHQPASPHDANLFQEISTPVCLGCGQAENPIIAALNPSPPPPLWPCDTACLLARRLLRIPDLVAAMLSLTAGALTPPEGPSATPVRAPSVLSRRGFEAAGAAVGRPEATR
jgi:hypothetical protein